MNADETPPEVRWWELPWYLLVTLGLLVLALPAALLALLSRLLVRPRKDDDS